MTETIDRERWPARVAAGSALLVTALGLTVLAGWLSHTPALIQVLPQLPPMTRNASPCLVLCGLALLAITVRGPRWLVVLLAGPAGAVSLLTIVQSAAA